MAQHMSDNNRKTGMELDRILQQRKKREAETQHIEEQIDAQYNAIQKKIKELEPGKLRAYNDLLAKQKDYHDRFLTRQAVDAVAVEQCGLMSPRQSRP